MKALLSILFNGCISQIPIYRYAVTIEFINEIISNGIDILHSFSSRSLFRMDLGILKTVKRQAPI